MPTGARFLIGFVGGAAALVGALALVFVGLAEAGRLKAPPFANRLSFDEKLRQLRATPPADVEVLLVGSSTTLHGVDGAVLKRELGVQGGVLNLGVQALRVHQTRFLTDVFVRYLPEVRQVIMVASTLDFTACGEAETGFFRPEHVVDYLSGGSELYYYFKYLDLAGTVKRAGEIAQLRRALDDLESVSFDQHGSVLLEVPRERISDRVWQGDPLVFDSACYRSLRALAEDLRGRGIGFTYVNAPKRPGYLALRDPDGALLTEHGRRVHDGLQGTGAVVIDANDALQMPEEAFFDAYHLKRDEARRLTAFVGQQIMALAGGGQGSDGPEGSLSEVPEASGPRSDGGPAS